MPPFEPIAAVVAFRRRTEQTYDGAHWLKTGEMRPMGEVTVTTITAEPR